MSSPVDNPYLDNYKEIWIDGKTNNQNTENPSLPVLVRPEKPKKGVVYNETSH